MICYFDSAQDVNLSHIEQVRNVRPLTDLKKRFSNSNIVSVTSTEYSTPGIYLIEVSKHSYLWCGKTIKNSDNILLNLPSAVLNAVYKKKLRIVILSIIEGDNFAVEKIDSFQLLHSTAKLLGLPKYSVLIISGNLFAKECYQRWCEKMHEDDIIDFIEGIEWDGKTSNQIETPVDIKSNAYAFNSLNRAHRNHRTDHLYFLAANNMLDNSLVSGGHWFEQNANLYPTYCVDEKFDEILKNNYPKSIDVEDLKDTTPNLINNLEIYRNSMLTVVTESHFDQSGGLFITEKTFRPILLGHPFICLSQPNLIKKLYEYGFNCEYLDSTYDTIDNNKERFLYFHETLKNWYELKHVVRKKIIQQWNEQLLDNFLLYKKLDFKKIMFDNMIKNTESYFREFS